MTDNQADKQAADHPANFEEAINNLEKIVERLESGQLGLEESLSLFEKGIGLSKQCQQALDSAQLRVEGLMKVFSPVHVLLFATHCSV